MAAKSTSQIRSLSLAMQQKVPTFGDPIGNGTSFAILLLVLAWAMLTSHVCHTITIEDKIAGRMLSKPSFASTIGLFTGKENKKSGNKISPLKPFGLINSKELGSRRYVCAVLLRLFNPI